MLNLSSTGSCMLMTVLSSGLPALRSDCGCSSSAKQVPERALYPCLPAIWSRVTCLQPQAN